MKGTASAQNRREITDGWLENLAVALEGATGAQVLVRRAGSIDVPASTEMIWWKGRAAAETIWVGVEKAAWASLASRVAGGLDLPVPGDAQEAYAALLNQSWGRAGVLAATAPAIATLEAIRVTPATGEPIDLLLAFGGPAGEEAGLGALDESALGVLLDIELPVTLRFGRTRMMLDDVLTLNTGSVVEFDRPLTEPIEVLVNGHVVARGEAVTVQGNYAVRICEIVSRGQRLDSGSGRAKEELL
jgi:flagellar motor switch protein FliN/FliY